MERELNIRREFGILLRVGQSLYHLSTLIEKEEKIYSVEIIKIRARETIRTYEFLPENHLCVREGVEALRRGSNMPLSKKKTTDDLTLKMKLQHPRQVIAR